MKAHLRALSVVGGLVILFLAVAWFIRGPQTETAKPKGIETLPSFSAKNLDGKTIRSDDYKGKVLIVNFWASWCAPCVEEVPSLVKLAEEMKSDVKILALSNDNTRADIDVFLKSFPGMRNNPSIEIIHDTGQGLAISKMFSVFQLPESFVFDAQGHMARKVVGSINWATPDAIAYLRDLAAKK